MTAMRLHRYPSQSGGFALGKMGVGATMLKQGATARDYIQNGLVAMWDGIENAGWGVHDPNATSWKNLIGDVDATRVNGTMSWSDNALVFSRELVLKVNSLFGQLQKLTIEVCNNAVTIPGDRYGALFSCMESGGIGIQQQASTSSFSANVGNPSGGYYGTIVLNDALGIGNTLTVSVDTNVEGYKNGVLVGKKVGAAGIRYNSSYNYYQLGRDPGDYGSISGPIYSVRLYSRALTAEEISRNYAIDKERFNLP